MATMCGIIYNMEHGMDQHVNIGSTDADMTEPLKRMASDKLLLYTDKKFNDITMAGIIIPNVSMRNNRLKEYKVVDIGERAKEMLGIDKGVSVSADQLARYYDSFPYSVIRWDSVICLRDENHAPHPLPGFAMMEMCKPENRVEGGITIMSDIQPKMKCLEVNYGIFHEYEDLIKPGMLFLPEECECDKVQEGSRMLVFIHVQDIHIAAEF